MATLTATRYNQDIDTARHLLSQIDKYLPVVPELFADVPINSAPGKSPEWVVAKDEMIDKRRSLKRDLGFIVHLHAVQHQTPHPETVRNAEQTFARLVRRFRGLTNE